MVWPAVIAAGAAIGSSLLSSYSSNKAARSQAESTENAAQHQYQWGVADAKAAGLNPYLVATNGGNVSGSYSMAQTPNYSDAVSSAIQAYQAKKDAELKDQQINTLRSQQTLNIKQGNLASANAHYTDQQSELLVPAVTASRDHHDLLKYNYTAGQLGNTAKQFSGLLPSFKFGGK